MRAKPLVRGLEVETAVEIESWAIFVELGPNARPVHEDEVHLLGP